MAVLGPKDVIIVLVMLLVIFGSRRLPEMGRSLGHGLREFKQSLLGRDTDEQREVTKSS